MTEPRQLKYVIVECMGVPCGIVFNEILAHSEVVRGTPVSAGFCRLGENRHWACWGKSTTLGISSKEGDAEILDFMMDETF